MIELTKEDIKGLVGHENPVILDIGCYDGKDSRQIAEQFRWGIVYCFDADERSQALFIKLNENHKVSKKLILCKAALSNVDGKIAFHLSDSRTRRHYDFQKSWSASSSIRKPKHHSELFPDVEFTETVEVPSMKLDTWYKKVLIDKEIDFAWVDVNGAEEDLVLGGLNTLKNYTRYLYIETSDKECYEGEIKRQQLLDLLPEFEVLGIYNDEGNFGNVLLKNKNL